MEQVYGEGGIRGVSPMKLLHTFWSTDEELGENFKETWVILNPNDPMPFIPGTTNEENK